MIPTLGAPLGLLALVALAPLVAAYFLRRKQRPVPVSALFLWRTAELRAQAGPRLQRFQRELSLLLEALAIIAAALYLADLRLGAHAERRHRVVVVDGGMSMSARGKDGAAVAERVRQAVAKLSQEQETTFTVVETGLSPRLLAGPQVDAARALAALETWRPLGPGHDPAAAFLFAHELAGPAQRVDFFTDAAPPESGVPDYVRWVALGVPLDNVAFLSAQRKDDGARSVVTVRVFNASAASRTVEVAFEGAPLDGKAAALKRTQALALPAGESAVAQATFIGAGDLTVTLPDDALPEDGHLRLPPTAAAPVQVSLLAGLDAATVAALDRFLARAPGVARAASGVAPELTFGPRGSGGMVTVGAPGKARAFVGPFFAEKAHPVLDDVELAGVVWTVGEPPPGHALVGAGGAVMLAEDEAGALHLNLDLARSNVQRTTAWPVLLSNLVTRARERRPGLARAFVMLGEEVPVTVEPGARYAFEGPDGSHPVLGAGQVVLAPFHRPGTYRLLRDGAPLASLEVLPIDPGEVDLRRGVTLEREAKVGDGWTEQRGRPRSPWPLVVLLALLFADFAVTARSSA